MKFPKEFYEKMIAELEQLHKENSRKMYFDKEKTTALRKTIDILKGEIIWNK